MSVSFSVSFYFSLSVSNPSSFCLSFSYIPLSSLYIFCPPLLISLSLSLSLSLSFWLFSVCLSLCLSFYLSLCMSLSFSFSLCLSFSVRCSICLYHSDCVSICLFLAVCLSVCLSISLPLSLSLYISVSIYNIYISLSVPLCPFLSVFLSLLFSRVIACVEPTGINAIGSASFFSSLTDLGGVDPDSTLKNKIRIRKNYRIVGRIY